MVGALEKMDRQQGIFCDLSTDCIAFLQKHQATLQHAERLLRQARPQEALTLLEEICTPAEADDRCPPRAMLLLGRALLATGDTSGVHRMLQAAQADPALLAEAATNIEQWLSGEGREHDSMLLRHELNRMHSLHASARKERETLTGRERLHEPDEALAAMLREALLPWREDIRTAWLATRFCTHAPRWQHHELLLELRPRRWHFHADAERRLQRMAQDIRLRIPLCSGTLNVSLHPLHAPLAHVRNMRAHALQLELTETCGTHKTATAEQQAADNGILSAATTPRPRQATPAEGNDTPMPLPRAATASPESTGIGKPRRPALLRSTALAAMLLLPVWIGWEMVSNHDTRQQVAALEDRHTKLLHQRWWRREAAAGLFSPAKTVHAFAAALQHGEKSPLLPLLDAESRRTRAWTRITGAHWRGCGAAEIRIAYNHAAALWPRTQRFCPPLLLRREGGRWRIALRATLAAFHVDARGYWHLITPHGNAPRGWAFAFPQATGGMARTASTPDAAENAAAGSTARQSAWRLITPPRASAPQHLPVPATARHPATPPHDENMPALHTGSLEPFRQARQ